MKSVFLESYGCSLNKSSAEQLKGFLKQNCFRFVSLKKADFLIINTCAVKVPTENHMLNRIKKLFKQKKPQAKLIVFGCLPKINPKKILEISPKIIQLSPNLEDLCDYFLLQKKTFSPEINEARFNKFVSIIPICTGCLGECSYCCVRLARGKLKSYSIDSLNKKFSHAIQKTPEIWLTAQDTGCYGKDIHSNLPKLLETLLSNKGDFRIRVGMMNPHFLEEFFEELIPLFKDQRLYNFFHIPLQSGSDKILKAMNRKYSVEHYLNLIARLKKRVPALTLATDVIAGFPGESEKDFQETINVLKKINPDVLNISRFGERPGTKAEFLQPKVFGWDKKARSRKLTELAQEIGLKKNKKFFGKTMEILLTEKGRGNSLIGRNNSYKPVVIQTKNKKLLGEFVKVKIVKAFPTYLLAKIV